MRVMFLDWYICFGVALAIIAIGICLMLDQKRGMMRIFYGLIGLMSVGFVLYIPPFFKDYDGLTAIVSNFLNVLKMISLDANCLEYYHTILANLGNGFFAYLYNALLMLVHAALPVVSAMTAVTLIMRCLSMLQIRMLRGSSKTLYVFSQVNYQSTILAEDISKSDPKGKIVFLEPSSEADHTGLRDRIHCAVLDESIENIRAKAKRRQVHYYCISEDQEKNLNDALAVLEQLKSENQRTQSNNHIFLFSGDPMVELMMDSLDKGMVEVNVVNEARNVAYQLMEQHPLTDAAKDKQISVLVVGFSDVAEECVRAISWCGQLYNYSLKIRMLADFPEHWQVDFRSRFPGLFTSRYDVDLIDCKGISQLQTALEQHAADAGYIIVADRTEELTVQQAVFLRRFYYRQDPAFKHAPLIYTYTKTAEKGEAIRRLCTAEAKEARRESYRLTPFGVATEIYSFQNISDSGLEKLAKNVHLVYEDIFSDGEINAVEAIGRYNLFEVNKRSNRANALHIRYKLAAMGLKLSEDPEAEEVDFRDYLSEELLEQMTYAEHDRWMAFLESEGWLEASLEQVRAYQASGISKGRHNCPLLKMHPYICPFEDLKDCSDQLGLPDSTVYDRDLISRIPDIIHDRWGIAGKKYKIVKNTSQEVM